MIEDPQLKSVLNILKNKIIAELKDNFVAAYVHGSFATGDPTAESDLDIVIVIKKDISKEAITPLQEFHHQLYNELE